MYWTTQRRSYLYPSQFSAGSCDKIGTARGFLGRWLGQTLKLSCLHSIGRMCKYLHEGSYHMSCCRAGDPGTQGHTVGKQLNQDSRQPAWPTVTSSHWTVQSLLVFSESHLGLICILLHVAWFLLLLLLLFLTPVNIANLLRSGKFNTVTLFFFFFFFYVTHSKAWEMRTCPRVLKLFQLLENFCFSSQNLSENLRII